MAAESRDDIINHSHPAEYSSEQPQWLRDRLKWFTGLKFGIIVHWGPYSQWDCYESWPLVPADAWARPEGLVEWNERDRDLTRFQKDYWELNRTFNPESFKPEEWAELFRNAGAKYVALTTKHHDGFCLWDTRTTVYRITHLSCPYSQNPRSNVIREAFAAFRSSGLAVSCYFSKSDWKHPSYWSPDFPVTDRNPNYDTGKNPERWESFVRFVHEQIRELMSDYGKIDLLWLDGGQVRPPKQDIRMNEIARMAREFQPDLIIADRTVGGEFENIITPEGHIPEEPLGVPWEACIPLGKNWKYVSNESHKSTGELIRMLVETVS
ncbi:MAG: alpha-L-fucosidase, partial [Spirochaetia bacterium]|nr:alpha-L-fucosidase [Spirochaetia bacterium]